MYAWHRGRSLGFTVLCHSYFTLKSDKTGWSWSTFPTKRQGLNIMEVRLACWSRVGVDPRFWGRVGRVGDRYSMMAKSYLVLYSDTDSNSEVTTVV